ncbi:MAG: helix-turn-helix transcriptional regulator [Clostridia bacterium]|nr:helix-turn-helix transcriptional regulator [Clostridia bacterium]
MENFNTINTSLCESTNRIQLGLLCFGHAKVGTEWNGKIYNPIHSRLYYIADGGSYIITDENDRIELQKGNWYLLPSGCSFTYGCDSFMEHIYFHLKLYDVDGFDLLRKFSSPVRYCDENADIDFFIEKSRSFNITDGLKVHNCVYSVLLSIIEKYDLNLKSRKFSPCIEKAMEYIQRNLSAQLTVEEIASYAYVSKSALTKKFKQELSMSITNYVYDTLMFEAGQLLSQSNLSVASVSEKLGFSDQFYFSKRFKSKFGMSPRVYRRISPM